MIATNKFIGVLTQSPVGYSPSLAQELSKVGTSPTMPMPDRLSSFPTSGFVSVGDTFLRTLCAKGGEADLFAENFGNMGYALYVLGMLLSGVCVGFDYTSSYSQETGVAELHYFTASRQVMELLLRDNAFIDTAKAHKAVDAVFGDGTNKKSDVGNKVSACFKKGALPMIRLDIKAVTKGGIQFDAVIPTKFRTDVGQTLILWPAMAYMVAGEGYMNAMSNQVYSLISRSGSRDGSLKTRTVTASTDLITKFYNTLAKRFANEPRYSDMVLVHLKEADARGFRKGYSPTKFQWYTFNLGSSLLGSPVSVVRPDMIVSMTPVSDPFAAVDVADMLLDPDAVRRLFERRVRNWTRAELSACVPNSDQLPNVKLAREYVLSLFAEAETSDLTRFMRNNAFAFTHGNLEADLTLETSRVQRYTEGLKSVGAGPFSVDAIRDFLKAGPVKVVATSKKTGSLREYVVTNNADLLQKTYGALRYLGYESPAKALYELQGMVKSGEIKSFNSFLNRVTAAGVDGLIDFDKVPEVTSGPNEWLAALKAAGDAYEAERAGKPKREVNPNLIYCRSLLATHRGNYSVSVDVDNIQEVWA